MPKTVTLTREEEELIVFALGVMLGHLGSTPPALAVTHSILKKIEDAQEDEQP